MTTSVASLLSSLEPDPWRQSVGFSADVSKANEQLFSSGINESEAIKVIAEWLSRFQPCVFGRFAAAKELLSYCILTDHDLLMSDRDIRNKIQAARRRWQAQASRGGKSGFVILAVSPTIATAVPSMAVQELARRLCALYLVTDIEVDKIYLDSVELDIPGHERSTFRWEAGVNYFCSQGDGRWWHDHRIPGGLAFSVNSVGHMVKSAHLAEALLQLRQTMEASKADDKLSKVNSLSLALSWAMRTIDSAAITPSGKATELLPSSSEDMLECSPNTPPSLPQDYASNNFCQYQGYYHTDVTLPSEYFLPDIDRPKNIKPHSLDFTYLFDDSIDNPAFVTMGSGLQIRSDSAEGEKLPPSNSKSGKMRPRLINGTD